MAFINSTLSDKCPYCYHPVGDMIILRKKTGFFYKCPNCAKKFTVDRYRMTSKIEDYYTALIVVVAILSGLFLYSLFVE